MYLKMTRADFLAGLRCRNLVWWRVRERAGLGAGESDRQSEGFVVARWVARMARTMIPGGVVVGGEGADLGTRIAATGALLEAGERLLYAAAFEGAGARVGVEILRRDPEGGWTLIDVRERPRLETGAVEDLALQWLVAREAGLSVRRAQILRLRVDGVVGGGEIFELEDLSEKVKESVADVRARLLAKDNMLAGPYPGQAMGAQCREPDACPFIERCTLLAPGRVAAARSEPDGRQLGVFEEGARLANGQPRTKR